VLTEFRPDLTFLSELRLELDATLQAPARIAAEVDPNIHSCGSVSATGAADLAQPNPVSTSWAPSPAVAHPRSWP